MEKSDESPLIIGGVDRSINIKSMFPEFYKLNKLAVDSGRIRFIAEPLVFEGGVLIDLITLHSIFVVFN